MHSLNSICRCLRNHGLQLRNSIESGVQQSNISSVVLRSEFLQGFKIVFDFQDQDLFNTLFKDHAY